MRKTKHSARVRGQQSGRSVQAGELLEARRLLASSLSGYVYQDVNGNGVQDTGDTPMVNCAVNVYTGASGSSLKLYETLRTDSSGYYADTNLPLGVSAMAQASYPSGYVWASLLSISWTTSSYPMDQSFLATDHSVYRGSVFFDANANGVFDSTDAYSANNMRAYFDLNNDNAYQAGEPTSLTNTNGSFYIGNINPGTYVLRLIPAAGYTQTAPAAKTQTLTFGTTPTNSYTNAFGVYSANQTSTITGYSFNDANGDGVRQSTESRNANRTIYVDSNYNNQLDAGELSTTTDSNGLYVLNPKNLYTSQTYYVRQVLPAGYYATTQKNSLYSVTLAPGNTMTPTDVFGSFSQQFVVSGIVFNDADGHGVYDAGSDTPLQGRTVFADLNYDGRLSANEPTFVTDADGHYTLSFAKPGNYQIGQVVPGGYKFSRPPNTSTAEPYAYLSETAPTATIDLGSRAIVTNSIAVDPAFGVWNDTSVGSGISSGGIILLADGGWLARTATFVNNGYTNDQFRRFKSDGTLDTSFATNGTLTLDPGEGLHVFEQPDGKLIIAGSSFGAQYGVVRRFLANGTLDTGFGQNGRVFDFLSAAKPAFVNDIALAADGSILIASRLQSGTTPYFSYTPTLTKLSSSGVRQTGFGTSGSFRDTVVTSASLNGSALAATPDGGFLMVSDRNRLVKINAAGQIDTTFATAGVLSLTHGNDYMTLSGVHTLADGKLMVLGQAGYRALLGRFNADGTPDTTFGDTGLALLATPVTHPGVITVDSFADVLPLPDGDYLAVGLGQGSTEVSDLLLTRFNSNGTLDTAAFASGRGTYALSASNDRGTTIRLTPAGQVQIGATTLESHGLAVLRLPLLTAVLPNTLSVPEGGSLAITARTSEADATIASYAWDFDYDGQTFTPDTTGVATTFSAAAIDGPSTRVVALLVTDSNGMTTLTTGTVQITNVAPTATFSASIPTVTLGQGDIVGFNAQSDFAADATAGYRYSYDLNNDGIFDIVDSTGPASQQAGVPASYLSTVGAHVVRGRITDKDGDFTDYTTTITVNSVTPPPTDPASVTLEAETAALSAGTVKDASHLGFTGTGYADLGGTGSAVKWTFSRNAAGTVTLAFRYANGGTTNRPLNVVVNGVTLGTLPMVPTGGWSNWQEATISASLLTGANVISIVGTTSSNVNTDSLSIRTGATPPPPATGSISGFTFDDTDKDGVYDATENKTTGKTVFIDLDNDSVLDANEQRVTTTTGGAWSFSSLPAGGYSVRQVFTSGLVISTPLINVSLAAGQVVSGLTIGTKASTVIPPPTGNASIAGTAFNDNNRNAKYDTGDGIGKAVTMFLDTDNDGVLDAGEKSVITDSSGKFMFTGLAAGTYRVRRVFAAGQTYSTPLANITLTAGQVKTGILVGSKKA